MLFICLRQDGYTDEFAMLSINIISIIFRISFSAYRATSTNIKHFDLSTEFRFSFSTKSFQLYLASFYSSHSLLRKCF